MDENQEEGTSKICDQTTKNGPRPQDGALICAVDEETAENTKTENQDCKLTS